MNDSVEISTYNMYKSGGERHREMAKINAYQNRYASRSHHYKQDKARNFRKILDRSSHHARRNSVRDLIAHDRLSGSEVTPPPSSGGNNYMGTSAISGHKNLCH
jgi:hypothetical protein